PRDRGVEQLDRLAGDGNLRRSGGAVAARDVAAAIRGAPPVLEPLDLPLRPAHVLRGAPERDVRGGTHRGKVLLDPVVSLVVVRHLRQLSTESRRFLDGRPRLL